MGAKQSCAKRLEEPAREHRTFDLLVPTGVSEGDELKFRTAAGPYGLRVPEGVTPGRKLQVTVTVPARSLKSVTCVHAVPPFASKKR